MGAARLAIIFRPILAAIASVLPFHDDYELCARSFLLTPANQLAFEADNISLQATVRLAFSLSHPLLLLIELRLLPSIRLHTLGALRFTKHRPISPQPHDSLHPKARLFDGHRQMNLHRRVGIPRIVGALSFNCQQLLSPSRHAHASHKVVA